MNKVKKSNIKKNTTSDTGQSINKSKINTIASKAITSQNSNVKKILVRNSELPVPETRVIKSYLTDPSKEQKAKAVQVPDLKNQTESFEVPQLNSMLGISKKMDNVTHYRKTKICDTEKKLAVDEKVSRQVNFPYNQPIFKDLIPLKCDKVQTPPFIASRNPLPQKDKELILADFVEIKKIPNYYSLPNVELEDNITSSFNINLKLYKLLQINSR